MLKKNNGQLDVFDLMIFEKLIPKDHLLDWPGIQRPYDDGQNISPSILVSPFRCSSF